MANNSLIAEVLSKSPRALPRLPAMVLGVLAVAGLVVFTAHLRESPVRAWAAFLVSFLFFTGIAQAGVVLSAILQATDGKWGRPLKRLAESFAAFLPVSFVLFLVLLLGRSHLFPWIAEPVEGKTAYLNFPFFVARNIVGFMAIYGASFAFIYYSIRRDLALARESDPFWAQGGIRSRILSGWAHEAAEEPKINRKLAVLAPVVLLLYPTVYTLISFDFIMSLSPHWYSTMFGGWHFIGTLYSGLAAVSIAGIVARRGLRLERYITSKQFHDIGKLVFAFCMLWTYTMFAQYLVIWYGNLPEETGFLILRTKEEPWALLAKIVLGACFVFPFIVLLSAAVKKVAWTFFVVCSVVLAGFWLNLTLLVQPSLLHVETLPIGVVEIGTAIGFLGLFVLTVLYFLSRFPVLPIADPHLEAPGESEQH